MKESGPTPWQMLVEDSLDAREIPRQSLSLRSSGSIHDPCRAAEL